MTNYHPYDNSDRVNITTVNYAILCEPRCQFLQFGMDQNNTNHCIDAWLCATEKIGHSFVIPSIAFVGILLNVFNLVVLSSDRFPESSYTYLSALAVADLLSLAFFAVNGIGRGCYPGNWVWRAFEAYAYFPIGSITTTASIYLTVTVTVERYAFIYHPLKAKTWCSQSIARKVVGIVCAVSFVVNFPRFFGTTYNDHGELDITSFGRSSSYYFLSWFWLCIISIGPSIFLIFFNTLLIIGIHRTNRKRKALVGSGKNRYKNQDEATLTRTLIIVVCVFIIGEFPSSFTNRSLAVAFFGQGDISNLSTTGFRIAVLISTGLVVAQHSLNFVVYCVFNRRFCDVISHHYLPNVRCHRSNFDRHLVAPVAKEADSDNAASQQPAVSYV